MIKIIPSERIDYCGDCGEEHGYDKYISKLENSFDRHSCPKHGKHINFLAVQVGYGASAKTEYYCAPCRDGY